ncbi:MAG TPA: hypothetical protein VIK65_00840 [Candidatus Limnocylindrales bacterium]|jgi:hypothetical protein
MIGSRGRRLALVATSLAASLATGGVAAAAAPAVETSSVHIERAFIDCPSFAVVGVWDITHRLTLFVDADGTPTRDIERVDFSGRLVNASTGAWVPDSGTRIFFDTLAADGSFLTTYAVEVRHSQYVHTAGRTDFQTGAFHGRDGFGAGSISALCEALGE